MFLKKYCKNIIIITFFSIFLVSVATAGENHSWIVAGNGLVAHAGGAISGYKGTNSLESLTVNYENGHRVFEIDLNLTADNKLVAIHDWYGFSYIRSENEFKTMKAKGNYTNMSITDIMEFLHKHEDAYLITDTKSFDYEEAYIIKQFEEIRHAAEEYDAEILKRVIPQIYNQEMYQLVKNVYDFPSIIYTLYASPDSDYDVVEFVKDKEDIKVITMGLVRLSDEFHTSLKSLNKEIYIFTINDLEEINGLLGKGVHGIYTDNIVPKDIKK